MLVVAGHGETQDVILSAVAAQDLVAEVVGDPERIGQSWRAAGTVLVAGDRAALLAARGLPRRDGVFLVGAHAAELSRWSAPLSARVIQLPEGGAWLGAVLSERSDRSRAPVVAVIGASGGVGASTLATGLAELAAAAGDGAALVDADPLGGGIDLLLGAERIQGWRWPRLSGADGQLGDLRPYLPVVDGVSVVSMGREDGSDLSREPLAAIVGSLRAWHCLVVLDPGRGATAAGREALQLAGTVLLVVAASVRGVAAARATIAAAGLDSALVVLRHRRGGLAASLVSEALGLPVVAELPDEPRLAAAAEVGEPPARAGRRRYRRALARVLAAVTETGPDHG